MAHALRIGEVEGAGGRRREQYYQCNPGGETGKWLLLQYCVLD
ncbi:MAG TPA: hypothetical protein VLT60_10080 [Usitatibacter sp.]|nr:hypothetical protein [Usitatibacter sp.]